MNNVPYVYARVLNSTQVYCKVKLKIVLNHHCVRTRLVTVYRNIINKRNSTNLPSCSFRCRSWAFPSHLLRRHSNVRMYCGVMELYSLHTVCVLHSRSSPGNLFDRLLVTKFSLDPAVCLLCSMLIKKV